MSLEISLNNEDYFKIVSVTSLNCRIVGVHKLDINLQVTFWPPKTVRVRFPTFQTLRHNKL